jgi:predicted nucleotidyltransferase
MQSALREQASGVAKDLVDEFPQVKGICLFGSAARGDAGPDSDLDLFVIGNDPELTPSSIRRRLHLKESQPKVSIVYHTPQTLQRYLETGSRFLLHLQLEGKVLYDDSGMLRGLKRHPLREAPIRAEVNGQLKRLALYDDPARYNGNFLFPLSHIYAIGKAIVMAILAQNEIFEFHRERAFDAFATLFPSSCADVETVRRLSAFYGLVSKGVERELPFSYHDCEDEVAQAVAAVRRIAERAADA